MKKIDSISNKIKNGNSNYLGKGSFEKSVISHKDKIESWLEELVSLQEQIKILSSLGCKGLQKRNYARILTKHLPQEYSRFSSINILLRDSDYIASVRSSLQDSRKQYEKLKEMKKLKSPGKHDKYVEYELFQEFVEAYDDELKNRAESILAEEEAPVAYIKKEKKKEATNWMEVLLNGKDINRW